MTKRGRGRPRKYPVWRPTLEDCKALMAEREAAERLYSLIQPGADDSLASAEQAYIMARIAAPQIGD